MSAIALGNARFSSSSTGTRSPAILKSHASGASGSGELLVPVADELHARVTVLCGHILQHDALRRNSDRAGDIIQPIRHGRRCGGQFSRSQHDLKAGSLG